MSLVITQLRKNYGGFSGSTTSFIFSCKMHYHYDSNKKNAEILPPLRRVQSLNMSNLFLICTNGKLALFKKELSKYGDEKMALNAINQNGNNCLMIALIYGHIDIITFLLQKGNTNLHHINYDDETAAMIASKNSDTYIIELLMCNGFFIDINQQNSEGLTALHIAVQYGNLSMVQFLLKNGADINKRSLYGMTPLMSSIILNQSIIAFFLINSGANIEFIDNYGHNALYFSIKYNNVSVLRYLIHHSAKLNVVFEEGYTPLMIAILNRSIQSIDLLLEQGDLCFIDRTNDEGYNALYIAMDHCFDDIVEKIFKRKKK